MKLILKYLLTFCFNYPAMPKSFLSSKSVSFGLLLLFVSLLIIYLSIVFPWSRGEIHSFYDLGARIISASVVPALALWIWYGTYYVIDSGKLIARSGPLVFKIDVSQISAVRLNQKTIVGLWKPTTSWKSILVEYNKSETVNISPVNQEEFLAELLRLNPDIEVNQE